MINSAVYTFPRDMITTCDFFVALSAHVRGRAVMATWLLAGEKRVPRAPTWTVGANTASNLKTAHLKGALNHFDDFFLPFMRVAVSTYH